MLESFALVVLRFKWKPQEFLILDGAQELTFLTIRDCRSRSSKLRNSKFRKKRELKILPEFFWKRGLAAFDKLRSEKFANTPQLAVKERSDEGIAKHKKLSVFWAQKF